MNCRMYFLNLSFDLWDLQKFLTNTWVQFISIIWLENKCQPGKNYHHLNPLFVFIFFQASLHIVNFHPTKHTCGSWQHRIPDPSFGGSIGCSPGHTDTSTSSHNYAKFHNSTPCYPEYQMCHSNIITPPRCCLSAVQHLTLNIIWSIACYWSQTTSSTACQT